MTTLPRPDLHHHSYLPGLDEIAADGVAPDNLTTDPGQEGHHGDGLHRTSGPQVASDDLACFDDMCMADCTHEKSVVDRERASIEPPFLSSQADPSGTSGVTHAGAVAQVGIILSGDRKKFDTLGIHWLR